MDNKKKLQKKTEKRKEQRTLMSFAKCNCICDCMSPGMGHPYEGASHNSALSMGRIRDAQ